MTDYGQIFCLFQDYIHRIGRTGRGEGQGGQALIFLQPHEKQFVNILKNVEVKINEIEFCGDSKDIQDQVRKIECFHSLVLCI